MRVAVISPYYNEPSEKIKRCRDSVVSQSHQSTHILVADGKPKPEIDEWDVEHMILPNHADYGDTPRALAAMSAAARGFDAVCFLDADNWFEPNHVASLVSLHEQSGAEVVTSGRMLRRMDGSLLGPCKASDGQRFNDTNCYLITCAAFRLLPVWIFREKKHACVGDRVFWDAVVKSGCKRVHSPEYSVNYETQFAGHYLQYNEKPPPGAKILVQSDQDGQPEIMLYTDYLSKQTNTPSL